MATQLESQQSEETSRSQSADSEKPFFQKSGQVEAALDSDHVKTRWPVRLWQCAVRICRRDRPSDPEESPYSIESRVMEDVPLGYPRLATFQASDRNFLLYRGFKDLHCRLLSKAQWDVNVLEEELHELDEFDNDMGTDGQDKLGCLDRDVSEASEDSENKHYPQHLTRMRPQVLKELKAALLEYDELLLKAKEVFAIHQPSKADYDSVKNWFECAEPIVQRESRYIRLKEDIITLRSGRECAAFDTTVEGVVRRLDNFVQKWLHSKIVNKTFLTRELACKTREKKICYYSPARIDNLVNVVIMAVIFVLLVLPVVAMYELTTIGRNQSPLDAIGILIVFTLVFGMAISSLTTAKRSELFGACAGYCAVLVVFIGNFGVQEVELRP